MSADARWAAILERLATCRQVTCRELAPELGCSPKTIRRDLQRLEAGGHLRRAHGGAVALTSAPALPPVRSRSEQERRAKALAATAAMAAVPFGGMVFLGSGSTVLDVAVRLTELGVRTSFVTNALDIADLLSRNGRHEVHMTGGELHAASRTADGPDALRFLDERLFDLAIVGAASIDPREGVMGPTPAHAALAATLRRRARRIMVVADHTKIGRSDRYVLYPPGAFHVLATDRSPAAELEGALHERRVQLLVGARREI